MDQRVIEQRAARRFGEGRPGAIRDQVETVLQRASHLAPGDRVLVESVYDRGMAIRDVARIVERHPSVVRRRLHRLVSRVCSPRFLFVLRHRWRWPAPRRAVGELVHLQGVSQRDAARRLGLSVHHVRAELARIDTLLEHDIDEAADDEGHDVRRTGAGADGGWPR